MNKINDSWELIYLNKFNINFLKKSKKHNKNKIIKRFNNDIGFDMFII